MTAGIETSKSQLAEILKRVERLEDEQNGVDNYCIQISTWNSGLPPSKLE
jgi:uncharacterized protein (UPF0335 family)